MIVRGKLKKMNPSLILLIISGVLLSFQVVNIRKHYISVNSKKIENQYFLLLPITIINLTLIVLSLIFGQYIDVFYSLIILIGMSIGLIGDINNKSINSSIKGFIFGSIIFIITYLCYSIALIYTSNGLIIPLDFLIIGSTLLIYIFLVISSWEVTYFQHLGKFRLITNFYPVLLMFLLSRAIVNLFQSSLPFLNVLLLLIGVLLFFITDMEFSIDKFFKPLNHMIGPILYPLGQISLVLSTILLSF
jgi:hypothetical protein